MGRELTRRKCFLLCFACCIAFWPHHPLSCTQRLMFNYGKHKSSNLHSKTISNLHLILAPLDRRKHWNMVSEQEVCMGEGVETCISTADCDPSGSLKGTLFIYSFIKLNGTVIGSRHLIFYYQWYPVPLLVAIAAPPAPSNRSRLCSSFIRSLCKSCDYSPFNKWSTVSLSHF